GDVSAIRGNAEPPVPLRAAAADAAAERRRLLQPNNVDNIYAPQPPATAAILARSPRRALTDRPHRAAPPPPTAALAPRERIAAAIAQLRASGGPVIVCGQDSRELAQLRTQLDLAVTRGQLIQDENQDESRDIRIMLQPVAMPPPMPTET